MFVWLIVVKRSKGADATARAARAALFDRHQRFPTCAADTMQNANANLLCVQAHDTFRTAAIAIITAMRVARPGTRNAATSSHVTDDAALLYLAGQLVQSVSQPLDHLEMVCCDVLMPISSISARFSFSRHEADRARSRPPDISRAG